MSSNPLFSGAYVPSTYIFDIQQLQQTNLDPTAKELLVRLYQNINNIILVLNTKETGLYPLSPFITSEQWFPNPNNNSSTTTVAALRPVHRKTFLSGPLPNTGTLTIPHGLPINANYTFTNIYATASDTTGFNYIPIPYASVTAVADQVEIRVDSTNIYIITGANLSNYNIVYVILEYLIN